MPSLLRLREEAKLSEISEPYYWNTFASETKDDDNQQSTTTFTSAENYRWEMNLYRCILFNESFN